MLCLLAAACGGGDADGGAAEADAAAQTESAAAEQAIVEPTEPVAAQASEPEAAVADATAEDPQVQSTPTIDPKDDTVIELPDAPPPPPTEGLPGGRYVRINDIAAEDGTYLVDFEPFNFEPLIGSGPEDYHIHFFWDTLEPQNAGTNGPAPGDWFLYDGPSPFSGYSVAEKPGGAARLCALVADAAHGVTLETGNCVELPA